MADIKPGSLYVGEGVIIKGTFDVPDMAAIAGLVEGELTQTGHGGFLWGD